MKKMLSVLMILILLFTTVTVAIATSTPNVELSSRKASYDAIGLTDEGYYFMYLIHEEDLEKVGYTEVTDEITDWNGVYMVGNWSGVIGRYRIVEGEDEGKYLPEGDDLELVYDDGQTNLTIAMNEKGEFYEYRKAQGYEVYVHEGYSNGVPDLYAWVKPMRIVRIDGEDHNCAVTVKWFEPEPTPVPTWAPWYPDPTQAPTAKPTQAPTAKPTQAPTAKPTQAPTPKPTPAPTLEPVPISTPTPTPAPQLAPVNTPTPTPAPQLVDIITTVPPAVPPTATPYAGGEVVDTNPILTPEQEALLDFDDDWVPPEGEPTPKPTPVVDTNPILTPEQDALLDFDDDWVPPEGEPTPTNSVPQGSGPVLSDEGTLSGSGPVLSDEGTLTGSGPVLTDDETITGSGPSLTDGEISGDGPSLSNDKVEETQPAPVLDDLLDFD